MRTKYQSLQAREGKLTPQSCVRLSCRLRGPDIDSEVSRDRDFAGVDVKQSYERILFSSNKR
jgi:hypothetical protein